MTICCYCASHPATPCSNRFRCHNGQPQHGGETIADLRGTQQITDWKSDIAGHVDVNVGGKFTVSYGELHRFVRRPGIESDIHLLAPMEYHAGTTELVQLLRKGHYGVELDAESWDRLVTWIDLNGPYHGTWTEIAGERNVRPIAERKRQLLKRYAGVDDEPESIPAAAVLAAAPARSPNSKSQAPRSGPSRNAELAASAVRRSRSRIR